MTTTSKYDALPDNMPIEEAIQEFVADRAKEGEIIETITMSIDNVKNLIIQMGSRAQQAPYAIRTVAGNVTVNWHTQITGDAVRYTMRPLK